VDLCDRSGDNHKWNPKNIWNIDRYSVKCYDCKTEIKHCHFGCDYCFRHICDSCDHGYNNHASMTWSAHISKFR
jgi:hypothetical protein